MRASSTRSAADEGSVRLAIGWSLEHDPRLATSLIGASSYLSSDATDVVTARYLLARAVAETRAAFPSARTGKRGASLFGALGDEQRVALLCSAIMSFEPSRSLTAARSKGLSSAIERSHRP